MGVLKTNRSLSSRRIHLGEWPGLLSGPGELSMLPRAPGPVLSLAESLTMHVGAPHIPDWNRCGVQYGHVSIGLSPRDVNI